MVEIIDNAVQLAVLTGCCMYTAALYMRKQEQVWFLLTCFYGVFALGLAYWLLFIVFYAKSPKISPVSDLSWLAGVLFLLVLQNAMRLPEEERYRPFLPWVAPAFSVVMCLFFFRWGDYILNILWAVLMGACGYSALRGWLFACRQSGEKRDHRYFHIAVLAFILVEYCLWLASCYGEGNSLSDPYYWFDFLLTAVLFILLPALKKAVGE